MVISFSDYLKSRDVLLGQLNEDPVYVNRYELVKYCKISIGESLNVRDMYILRPKDIISVRWTRINGVDKCVSMIINGVENSVYWSNDKILKWLSINTKEL